MSKSSINNILKSLWFISLMLYHPVAGVREDSAQFLGELKISFAIPFLFYTLDKDPVTSVKSEAADALRNFKRTSIPGLLERLHSPDAIIRYLAASALHRISSELINEPHPYHQLVPSDEEDYETWRQWFETRSIL